MVFGGETPWNNPIWDIYEVINLNYNTENRNY